MVLCTSHLAAEPPPENKCQWVMGSPAETDLGCVGRVGLIRLSRDFVGPPRTLRHVTMVLFGQEELPPIGAEIRLRRPVHLREWYDEARDEQLYSRDDVHRSEPFACTGWCDIEPTSRMCFGLFPTQDEYKFARECPGATDQTQYFGINTKVKILGYQLMGNIFVNVQILEPDSKNPVEKDQDQEYEHNEIL